MQAWHIRCIFILNIPSDSTSLSDNSIQRIFKCRTGKLWIIRMNSFPIKDPVSGKFLHDDKLFDKNTSLFKDLKILLNSLTLSVNDY